MRDIIWKSEPDEADIEAYYEDARQDYKYTGTLEEEAEDIVRALSETYQEELEKYIFPEIEKQCNYNTLILQANIGVLSTGVVIKANLNDFDHILFGYDSAEIYSGNPVSVKLMDHDGTATMNLYTLPSKEADMIEIMKLYDENLDEEFIDIDDFASDLASGYTDEKIIFNNIDKLVPIKL